MILPRLAPRTLLAAAGALFLVQALIFWPGIVDSDSAWQYREARTNILDDWHPPAMTRLWQGLEALGLHGSGPLFTLHLALFWAGIALIAAGLARRGQSGAAIATLAVPLIVPIFAWMTLVIKDSSVVAALTIAIGVVAHYRLAARRIPLPALAGVVILLTYATMARANTVFAVAALATALAYHGRAGVHPGRAATAGLLSVALFVAGPALNQRVMAATPAHALHSLLVFDIAGTAHMAHLETVSGLRPEQWAAAERRGCYTPYFWDKYSTDGFCPWVYAALDPRPGLFVDWASTIAAHPIAYLEHRLYHWNTTMRFLVPAGMVNATADESSSDTGYAIGSPGSWFYWKLYRVQLLVAETPIAWPGIYFFLCAAMTAAAVVSPRGPARDLALAIAASGAAQMASALTVSVASDIRYHLWGMVAGALAAAILYRADGVSSRAYRLAWLVTLLAVIAAVVARATLTTLPWPLDAS